MALLDITGAFPPIVDAERSEGQEFGESSISIDLGWMFKALRSTNDTGIGVIASVVDGVNTLIAAGEFRLLDKALTNINVATASKHVLLGLARSTFPVRTKLTAWRSFVNGVDEAFHQRNLDSARLLKGLLT